MTIHTLLQLCTTNGTTNVAGWWENYQTSSLWSMHLFCLFFLPWDLWSHHSNSWCSEYMVKMWWSCSVPRYVCQVSVRGVQAMTTLHFLAYVDYVPCLWERCSSWKTRVYKTTCMPPTSKHDIYNTVCVLWMYLLYVHYVHVWSYYVIEDV